MVTQGVPDINNHLQGDKTVKVFFEIIKASDQDNQW